MNFKNKFGGIGWRAVGPVGSGLGGQGGCEGRIEVYVKNKKNRGVGGRVRLVGGSGLMCRKD